MDLQTIQQQPSHTSCTKLEIDLDFCNESFGVAPCVATGTPCYNTYHTCTNKENYNRGVKTYKFISNSVASVLPFPGPKPYLENVKIDPTEIKDSLTVKSKATIDLSDDLDGDVAIDPYRSQRADVPWSSFWRKLLARNPNYMGRPARIYEGALGLTEAEFDERWKGKIKSIILGRSGVRIIVADLLMSLRDIETPTKAKVKIVGGVSAGSADIVVSDVSKLTPSGYIRGDDVIISYTGITTAQNKLTGCAWGLFGTVAEDLGADTKVEPITYYAPQNPFDILKGMLLNDPDPLVSYPYPPGAGLDASDVDSVTWDYWRDWPGGEIDFSAIIVKPTKLDELFWEIVDLLDCKVWYSEGQKITIRRTIPNQPGRTYTDWDDDSTVIDGSGRVDLNPDSRISKVILRWDRTALGDEDKAENYRQVDVSVIADAESANDYGEPAEEEIFCRWLRSDYLQEEKVDSFIRAFTARRVLGHRDALPLLDFEVYVKDGAVRTGAMVRYTGDELLLPDGTPLDQALFEVVKRHPKGHKLGYRLLKMPGHRVAFFAPAGTPAYTAASEAQREYGFFCDENGLMSNGDQGYKFW
jgi:hypothetical protein